MKMRNKVTAAAAAALLISSSAATADNNLGAFAVGAAVGAIVNHQVNKNRQQRQQQQRVTTQRSQAYSYQRQQNREVQSALNAFNFPVGTVDGALGPKSRAAISNYQSYMGYQPTGYLEDYQRRGLVDAHQRLQAGGGAAYPEVVANEGTQGLLKAFADPNYVNRYRNTGVQQAALQNNNGVVDRGLNQNAPAPVATGTAPVFAPLDLSGAATSASMASHCDLVSGITQANQGVVLPASVTDPEQALGEQFCEARAYAITQSQGTLSQAGQSADQITVACGQIADLMQPATGQIGTGDIKLVATEAQKIANTAFNGDMETAAAYGEICLGIGYRQDDAKVALGAATVLLAAGQVPYSEVMGHHLRWGFGTAKSPQASTAWYETALSSMRDGGAQPVFVPSKTAERNAIIQASIASTPQQAANTGGSLSLPPLNLSGN